MIGYTLEQAFEAVNMIKYSEVMLRACYAQEHRKYHNLKHLEAMLKHVPTDLMGVEVLIEAVLFHDVVYDIKPQPFGLNETLSACEYMVYALRSLGTQASPFSQDPINFTHERNVIEAIHATAHHDKDQEHLSLFSKLLLDLDLCSFVNREDFIETSELVWQEYAPFVDRQIFVIKRKAFLQNLLTRKTLYYLKTEWEQPARDNLQEEIQRLESTHG